MIQYHRSFAYCARWPVFSWRILWQHIYAFNAQCDGISTEQIQRTLIILVKSEWKISEAKVHAPKCIMHQQSIHFRQFRELVRVFVTKVTDVISSEPGCCLHLNILCLSRIFHDPPTPNTMMHIKTGCWIWIQCPVLLSIKNDDTLANNGFWQKVEWFTGKNHFSAH